MNQTVSLCAYLVFIFHVLTQSPSTKHHSAAHLALQQYHEMIMAQMHTSIVAVNSVVCATLPKMTIVNLFTGSRVQLFGSEVLRYVLIGIVFMGLRHIIIIGK